MNRFVRLTSLAGILVAPVVLPVARAPQPPPPSQRVARSELIAAMNFVRQTEPPFEMTATTNGSRFQGGVILRLVQLARERAPDGPPLFIDAEDSFEAYLTVAKLTRAQAPVFVQKAYEHKQGQLIEYRERAVIAAVEAGPQPVLAASVTASWPAGSNLPRSFSYEDTYSVPNLRVTNQRIVTYKLVKFDRFTLYDRISGVSGKPTSGALGVLFWFLGDSQVLQSRSAIASDGLQIVWAHAKWGWFDKTPIVTIQKDGKAEEGLDRTREELRKIEATLKQEVRLRYVQE